jgi:hypothetical protein
MSNIVYLDTITNLDIPPDRVLDGAMTKLDSVVVLGYDKDANEYFASSSGDMTEVLWLMERFRHKLLNGDFGTHE